MIRVYEFGCLRPIAGETEAIDQMRRRNLLWNALVQIENKYREEVTKLFCHGDEQRRIQQTIARLAELRAKMRVERKTARSKAPDISELKREIENTKASLSLRIDAAEESRKLRLKAQEAQLEALDIARFHLTKEATRCAVLYWCNYDEFLRSYNGIHNPAARVLNAAKTLRRRKRAA